MLITDDLPKQLPLKQGLKQHNIMDDSIKYKTSKATSIKTRIETLSVTVQVLAKATSKATSIKTRIETYLYTLLN